MASEIKVDTIVNAGGDNDTGIDLATNDQILLKVANATKLTMNSTGQTTIVGEGGSTTTSLQQGLVKAFASIEGQDSTATTLDTFNIGSLTDDGTGKYSVSLTNNAGNANYCTPTCSSYTGGAGTEGFIHTSEKSQCTTSAMEVQTTRDNASYADSDKAQITLVGDLA